VTLSKIVLRKGSARPVWAGHPNVYDGSIERVEGAPVTGEDVDVMDHRGEFLRASIPRRRT
jgi:23S rRNA G2069 N7-methylase RlmK/C1962 C5-methylase RlmI